MSLKKGYQRKKNELNIKLVAPDDPLSYGEVVKSYKRRQAMDAK